jgi:hypothetical protein
VVLDFVGSIERLNEVHLLAEKVRQISLEKENYEPRVRSEKQAKEKQSVIHNENIEVTYNEAAADVLELIENLNYKLNFRSVALNSLRRFYELEGVFPDFKKFHEELEGLTRDQVNTLFNSYLSFLMIAFDLDILDSKLNFIHEECLANYRSFRLLNGIRPSFKALSQDSIFEHLPLYTESEAKIIMSSNTESRETVSVVEPSVIDVNEIPSADRFQTLEEVDLEKLELLKKYQHLEALHELKGIPDNDMKKIKRTFKSKILFLKVVQSGK